MSRPQFQAKANQLLDLAMSLLANGCTPVELFEACERRWPWLKQPENWPKYGNGLNSAGAFHVLMSAYMDWTIRGRPAKLQKVDQLKYKVDHLRMDLAGEVIKDWDSRQARRELGGYRATPNKAGWTELDITYSCGCGGGLAWMRVDARGNLRDEEVAILAAREYYHQCKQVRHGQAGKLDGDRAWVSTPA